MKTLLTRAVKSAARHASPIAAAARNSDSLVELCVSQCLGELRSAGGAENIATISRFLAECFEPQKYEFETIVNRQSATDDASNRFGYLLSNLRAGVPPIAASVAKLVAARIDCCIGQHQPVAAYKQVPDVGAHAAIASSSGKKGRLVSAAVRAAQPAHCLELGTAYAIGTAFIASSLHTEDALLTTVEGFEPQYSISAAYLEKAFAHRVRPVKSLMRDLPDVLRNGPPIDFVFHDAGHTRDDYVHDFAAFEPFLSSGAFVLIDDIRWNDARNGGKSTGSYDGWREVAAHPRVEKAVEIGGLLGLLLVR
jgi:predicted O-methyltransferase YrrM